MSSGDQLSSEQQIALLEKQLVQAQRLAALGELVGTTTHEFNNVLMTILNYAKIDDSKMTGTWTMPSVLS